MFASIWKRRGQQRRGPAFYVAGLDFPQLVEVLGSFGNDRLEAFVAQTFDGSVGPTKFWELNARMAAEQIDMATIARRFSDDDHSARPAIRASDQRRCPPLRRCFCHSRTLPF